MVETAKPGRAATALLQALADGPLSRADIRDRLGLDWRQTTNATRSLIRHGFVELLDGGRCRLTEAGASAVETGTVISGGPKGVVKIVRDTFRERAWRAMRVRKAFTIGDIVADASSDADEGQPRDNAARYISRLKQAGYVRELPRRLPGVSVGSNGFKRFMLVRNTGPRAPIWRESQCAIHDPNTGEDVPCLAL